MSSRSSHLETFVCRMSLGKWLMVPTAKNRETDLGRIAVGTSARAARRLALTSWVLSSFFAAAALAIMILGWSAKVPANETGPVLNPVLIATVFPTIGAVVASRRPENPMGWIMCATGLLFALNALAGSYAAHALYSNPEPLPGAALAAWANVFTGNIGIFPFLLLLFPDGRLPSRRWRPVVWLVVGTTLAEVAFWAFAPGRFLGWPSERNPFGVDALRPFLDPYANYAQTPLLVLAVLLPAASLVARFWRSRGVERQQLKWVASSGVLVAFAGTLLLLVGTRSPELIEGVLWGFLVLTLCAIPISIGMAILRYRLWDIDLVINRALVYVDRMRRRDLRAGGRRGRCAPASTRQSPGFGPCRGTRRGALPAAALPLAARCQPPDVR